MVYIIKEHERGFLFKEGVFERMLMPGKYRFWGSAFEKGASEVRRVALTEPLTKAFTPAELAAFKRDPEFAAQTVVLEVPDGFIAIHRVDGLLSEVLPAGKYIFWNQAEKHSFDLYDMSEPEVQEDIPVMKRIDLSRYPRREHFEHFLTMENPFVCGVSFLGVLPATTLDFSLYAFFPDQGIYTSLYLFSCLFSAFLERP